MDAARREKRAHGTQAFPFHIYPALDAQESGLVPYHWHPEMEIITAESGTLELTIADRQYAAQPGDVFFVTPGQLHEIRGGADNRFHAFVFPLDFLQFSRLDLTQSELLAPLAKRQLAFTTGLRHDSAAGKQIRRELDAILGCCIDKQPGYQLLVKTALLRIVALAAQYHLLLPQQIAKGSEYKTALLRNIVEYLDAHCTEQLRLNDIAAHFGLSPQYFCTFFKENSGKTLTQHINFLRIERASRLLRETDEPIMEIGFMVGFENFSYFIKRFREVFACTPSAYRRAERSGDALSFIADPNTHIM